MEAELNKLWPLMCGENGFMSAIMAWRGFLAFIVPVINSKLQAKLTEMLVASPGITNDIVHKPWYKTAQFWMLVTIGLKLPSIASVLVHETKEREKSETAILDSRDMHPEKPKQNGFNILEVLITTAVIALIIGVACLCSGCNTYKGLFPGKNIIVEDFEADQSGWGVQSKIRAKKVQSNVAETNCHNPELNQSK